jgi:hypothetical protein
LILILFDENKKKKREEMSREDVWERDAAKPMHLRQRHWRHGDPLPPPKPYTGPMINVLAEQHRFEGLRIEDARTDEERMLIERAHRLAERQRIYGSPSASPVQSRHRSNSSSSNHNQIAVHVDRQQSAGRSPAGVRRDNVQSMGPPLLQRAGSFGSPPLPPKEGRLAPCTSPSTSFGAAPPLPAKDASAQAYVAPPRPPKDGFAANYVPPAQACVPPPRPPKGGFAASYVAPPRPPKDAPAQAYVAPPRPPKEGFAANYVPPPRPPKDASAQAYVPPSDARPYGEE